MEMVLEDGGGAAVALKDGGGVAALGGGIGRQFKIAAALGGGCWSKSEYYIQLANLTLEIKILIE